MMHVRFGSKADICSAQGHVRFTPNSDIDCVFRHVALGQKRTLLDLFDHLVGALLEMYRHLKTKRLSGLQIDHQLEFDRSLHGKFAWLLALKNAINIRRRTPKIIG